MRWSRKRGRSRGALLLDAAMATGILGVAMATTLQVIQCAAAHRRAADRRQFATETLANMMERLSLRPWDELPSGEIAGVNPDDATRSRLPGARYEAAVVDEPGVEGLRSLTLVLYWKEGAGFKESSVRLVAWVSRAGRPRR